MTQPHPVSRTGFEYYNNELYAVVPPHHRHRRYSVSELRDLFDSTSAVGSTGRKPAHWFRAQLVHYGLRATDNKGTAAMRLFDALRSGNLVVPEQLRKLEGEMKRGWQKSVRGETRSKGGGKKKEKKKQADGTEVSSGQGRKAGAGNAAQVRSIELGGFGAGAGFGFTEGLVDGSPNVTVSNVNINYYGGPSAAAGKSSASGKKAKANSGKKKKEPVKPNAKSNIAAKTAEPKKCTAPTPKLERHEYPDDKPIQQQTYPSPSPPKLTLGLLNGSYKIDAQTINTRNSGMILCLEKTSIWGEFQLGDMEGVLFMRDRPWEVSISDHGGCVFEWRGVDQSTGDIYANSDEHWGEMRFLGNGDIEGTFYNVISDKGDQLDCEFWGHRTSGRNETRAPRGAYSIRDEYFELGSGCD